MNANTRKAAIAITAGGLSAYLHLLLAPLVMLAVVMIVDHISGLLRAWSQDSLSSRSGLKGITKKVGCLLLVGAASIVDWLICCGLQRIGITIDVSACFGLMVTVWLIINELISIFENLGELGVPLPAFMHTIVTHLKNIVEKSGSKKD